MLTNVLQLVNLNDKGKPVERQGRKAKGLRPHQGGYDSPVDETG